MKKGSPSSVDFDELSDEQKDELIKTYQKQIQNSVEQVQPASYAFAGLMPEAGTIFSIMA